MYSEKNWSGENGASKLWTEGSGKEGTSIRKPKEFEPDRGKEEITDKETSS